MIQAVSAYNIRKKVGVGQKACLNASGKSELVIGFIDEIVYYLRMNSEFGKV
jgi:hypothetical protein